MAPNHNASVVESYSYSDLVDIPAFSRLLEHFFKAIGIPNGLVGANGEIICQAGWVDAGALFHRVNPDTKLRCLESNLELMQDLQDGEVVGCQCKNGLVHYATPVVIEGRQLASLFLGQVFNETPDVAFFQKQSAQFGFDESQYLDAIRVVPIIEKGRLEALMDCMVEMVARGEPLGDILNAIVNTVETEEPSSMCSILLMDKAGKHLLTGAAPTLPPFYNEAIHGIEIGMGVGSCGTARYRGLSRKAHDCRRYHVPRLLASLC